MYFKSGLTIFVLYIFAANILSQDTLTIDNAISLALQNNFNIQTAKNQQLITADYNTPGNAGMLPKISAMAAESKTSNKIDQEYFSAPEIKTNNAVTNTFNSSVTLSWTLFDGLKMFAVKSRLKRLEKIGELNYKQAIENIVAQIIISYFDIVSVRQQLKGLSKAVSVSEERVKIAEKQMQIGSISRVELLQTKLDLNEQKSAVLSQENILSQKKAALNLLLARSPETAFETGDSIPFIKDIPMIPAANLDAGNYDIMVSLKNLEIAKLSRREAISQYMPLLNVSGSYGYNGTENNFGQVSSSSSNGTSAGINISLPLFNGLNDWHQVKIAGLNISNAQITLANTRLQVQTDYFLTQKAFQKAKEILALEEENILLADENVKIAFERFKLAQSTYIELGTAEQSYVNALSRLVNARFTAKSAEVELMRIQGGLLK